MKCPGPDWSTTGNRLSSRGSITSGRPGSSVSRLGLAFLSSFSAMARASSSSSRARLRAGFTYWRPLQGIRPCGRCRNSTPLGKCQRASPAES